MWLRQAQRVVIGLRSRRRRAESWGTCVLCTLVLDRAYKQYCHVRCTGRLTSRCNCQCRVLQRWGIGKKKKGGLIGLQSIL